MAEQTTERGNAIGNDATAIGYDFLDAFTLRLDRSDAPFVIPWMHTPETPSGLRSFTNIMEWRAYIRDLRLDEGVWPGAAQKFQRAQKLYFLAWLDADLIKAGELVALTALELALKERYAFRILELRRQAGDRRRDIYLRDLLKHLVERDGLTDDKIPTVQKYGGAVVRNLYETDEAREARLYEVQGDRKVKRAMEAVPPMTIDAIRNRAAHGDPFDTLPWGGLLEVVRDLIHYASRDRVAEWQRQRSIHGENLEALFTHMGQPSEAHKEGWPDGNL